MKMAGSVMGKKLVIIILIRQTYAMLLMVAVPITLLLGNQCKKLMSLSLCAGNVVLECDETKSFSTFTCTGLTTLQTVWWKLTYDSQNITLGSCQPFTGGTSTCIPGSLPQVFQVSRTSATATSISAYSGTSLSTFSEKGSLTCTSLEGNDETTCPLDYIYPASGATCEVYFSTLGTWSVVANCSINKAKSVRRRYTCQLRQTMKSGSTVLLPAVQMSVTQTSPDGYVSGVCNITSFLPSKGQYTYEVTITPGNVNVSANFLGSNIIRFPRIQPSHNCSLYVDEGNTLSCRCFVGDSGDPSGFLLWDKFNSSELLLKDIQRSQNGIQSVCRLIWNNTVTQSVSYTLIVSYQPTGVNVTMNDINSKSVSVVEYSSIRMKCQADGRPAPAMIITKVSDNSILKSSPEGNITVEDKRGEVTHTVAVAQCSDSDEYRCTAVNSRGVKDQSVNLFVKCKPRRVPPQSNSVVPSIFEGKSESFELIAYPTSVNLTKYRLGPNITSNEGAASDDTFSAQCTPIAGVVYKITCTVTVNSVTPDTADYYKLRVSNGLGEVEFIFQAKPRDTTTTEKNDDATQSEFSRGLGTGLGVGLGIAATEAVVFTIVLVLCWRRNQRTSKTKGARERIGYSSRQEITFDKGDEVTLSSGQQHESPYDAIGNNETGHTPAYTNVQGSHLSPEKTANKTGKVYDGLQLQDVGVSSPYASLK